VDRGITAEIDLSAAAHNINALRDSVNGLPVIAVVKADAYGHGAPEISRVLEQNGVSTLAVAFVSEARVLRDSGLKVPLMVLFDRTEIPSFFDLNLTPVIHDAKTAHSFSKEASRRNTTLEVHIKVDTGMGRMGIEDPEDIEIIAGLPNLRIVGLLSHLSEADIEDREFVELQLQRFGKAKDILTRKGLSPMCHIANSAAALSLKECRLDAIRPGLALYGISPFGEERNDIPELRPVMQVKANIAALRRLRKGQPVSYGRTFTTSRDTLAAVLAVGYADGYQRALSNNSNVLIKGTRAPVLGRVCMDLVVVDVTDIESVAEEDKAVLMGRDGKEYISAWELAKGASTIPYEILTSFGKMCSKRTYQVQS
jgi:alanine racemase